MAESTFNAGPRAALDLRECSGTITLQDGDEPTIRIAAEGEHAPFVLREGDSFRVRMPGGTITLPAGLPVEVSVPPAVQLRIERKAREGGETVVKPVSPEPAAAEQTRPESDATGRPEPQTVDEFARDIAERAQRFFAEATQALRASNVGLADEIANRLDEVAERVAERVQREVERAGVTVNRAQEQARRAADRAEVHVHHVREKMERRAEREQEREARRAGRGRGWFADRLEEWAAANHVGPGDAPGRPANSPADAAGGTAEERRAILAMLSEGKITSEQAAKLLDALG